MSIFKRNKSITFKSLITLNKAAFWFHFIQGVTMLWLVKSLGTDATYDITANFLTFNQVTQALEPASTVLFSIHFVWLVASFSLLSALAHAIIITVYKKRYVNDLKQGINRARWIEYSISASIMMVAIALLSGMQDVASLLMVFGLVAVMNLLGLVMELVNSGQKKVQWASYIVGCIAGVVPWLAFGLYVWAANSYSSNGVPGFVYGIYISIFIFFNCFAINMYLQYKKIGPWKNYLYGERMYIVLSFVAKTALAWQVFGGVFQP